VCGERESETERGVFSISFDIRFVDQGGKKEKRMVGLDVR
jgi:hypothetical protein